MSDAMHPVWFSAETAKRHNPACEAEFHRGCVRWFAASIKRAIQLSKK
jgi:hypothetical protein